jgi:hypothetical protein
MNEGPQRASAILSVAQTWAQFDARAALSWLQMQSGSDATPDVYRAVFGQWAAYDAEAALSQTNFLLDSSTRNAAIIGVLQNSYLGADTVERLYQRLDGAEAKRHAAAQLYLLLRESNPQAAERYRIEAGIGDRNAGFVAQ